MEKVTEVRIDGFFESFRPINRDQYRAWKRTHSFGVDEALFYSAPNWRYMRVQTSSLHIEFDTVDRKGVKRVYSGAWYPGYTWDVASVPEKLRGIVQYDHPAMIVASLFHDSWYQAWTFDAGGPATRKACRKANRLFRELIAYFDEGESMDGKAWLGVALRGWDYYDTRSAFDLKMTEYCSLTDGDIQYDA